MRVTWGQQDINYPDRMATIVRMSENTHPYFALCLQLGKVGEAEREHFTTSGTTKLLMSEQFNCLALFALNLPRGVYHCTCKQCHGSSDTLYFY